MTRRRPLRLGVLALTLAAVVLTPGAGSSAQDGAGDDGPTRLWLVTLDGPGTAAPAGDGFVVPVELRAAAMRATQDTVLSRVDAPEPVYRWTTALNGVAVRLDDAQAQAVGADPAVALAEPNDVRPLAADPTTSAGFGTRGPRHGGTGQVVGVVDTGIAPESPLFAALGVSRRLPGFACATGDDWSESDCTAKVVGAQWFVAGFGEDRVRATTALSPRDTDGHGTQMASIAVGNADIPVRVRGEQLGRYGGMAPDARVAAYKACWSAPDPADDGCATADLVAAIDRAVSDRVDVLNLSVGGPAEVDTVDRALLGATEAGVVVVAAAGNTTPESPGAAAAHAAPWVTTVGGSTGDVRRGRVVLPDGRRLGGAMVSRDAVDRTRVVLASRAAAAGSSAAQARRCVPGSLDASRVADSVVVCERGGVGRVDKSEAVDLADGAAMVLVNTAPGSVDADVHAVPTVHLGVEPGRELLREATRRPGLRVRLEPAGTSSPEPRVSDLSASGRAEARVVKPDVVAPAAGVLGATPSGDGWAFVAGTSAATAYTAGVAATLLGRGATPAEVRSALVTSAAGIDEAPVLAAGTGVVDPGAARRPGLAYLVAETDYRSWLVDTGGPAALNTPSAVLSDGETEVSRTVTNVSGRRLYFSSEAVGFDRDVRVVPEAVRLGAGESATFRVETDPPARRARRDGRGATEDGYVEWRGATGTSTRMSLVLTP